MGEFNGGRGGLDYLKSCNKHIRTETKDRILDKDY